MDRREPNLSELLARVKPALDGIFTELEVSEEEAASIVEESCRMLIAKRVRRQNPERWLLRAVVEKCRRLKKGGKI